ncbi:MAG: Rrf2 family transcriptional regulator [Saprospiraceae bacterium]
MLSKSSKYGIRAVLHIAHESQQGRRVGLVEIANYLDTPQHFTGKIIQQLAKRNIIDSIKGPNGGFEMSEDQRLNNNIRSIVEIIDGNDLYVKCGLGLDHCHDDNPCPIHTMYKEARLKIINIHCNFSIEQLASSLDYDALIK